VTNGGTTNISESTITGNTATGGLGGGGLYFWGLNTITIQNSTIAGNSTTNSTRGGGIAEVNFSSSSLTLSSTIVAQNTNQDGSASDINQDGTSALAADYSLIGTTAGTTAVTGSNNLTGVSPGFTTFVPSDNGGPTPTLALLAGSPALDSGTANGFTTDQRGSGFPRTFGGGTDVGAFEVGNVAPTASSVSIGSVRVEGTAIAVRGSVTDPAGANDVLTYAWAVYKDGGATPFATGSGADWSFTPDDNGSYRVVLTVSDGDGGSGTAEQTIAVSNAAPTGLSLSAPAAVDAGQSFTLTGTFADAGPSDAHAVTVHWGDGTTDTLALAAGVTTFTATHTYATRPDGGTAAIGVTVGDGAAAASATASVAVNSPPVDAPNPPVATRNPAVVAVGSADGGQARLSDAQTGRTTDLQPFPDSSGGVRAVSADFNGDGVADLVAGTGPGTASRVRVLDGATGRELFAISPFEGSFTGGTFVAAGDINGGGVPDLVITPDQGGGPRVRVFSGTDFSPLADFFGIGDPSFRGGARAAVGDLNADGFGELAVSAGFGGGPRVSVYDGAGLTHGELVHPVADFFLFESTLRNGVYLAVGDVNGDGFGDIVGGAGPGGGPRVLAISGQSLLAGGSAAAIDQPLANFFAEDTAGRSGVRVAAKNLDGDQHTDLVTGDGAGAGSRVAAYRGMSLTPGGTPEEAFSLDAFPGSLGGVFVG
jgi:hypothetical protein